MKKKTVIEPNGHVDIHKHTFRGNNYPKPETFDLTPITAKATKMTQLVGKEMINKQQLEQPKKVRKTFYTKPHALRWRLNKLSQKYEIRRPHFEGKKESSCSMILPAKFVEHIGIEKGDYVRIYEEQNRIIVERMANQIESGGQIDTK